MILETTEEIKCELHIKMNVTKIKILVGCRENNKNK